MEYVSPVILLIPIQAGDIITTSPTYDEGTETPAVSLGGGDWSW